MFDDDDAHGNFSRFDIRHLVVFADAAAARVAYRGFLVAFQSQSSRRITIKLAPRECGRHRRRQARARACQCLRKQCARAFGVAAAGTRANRPLITRLAAKIATATRVVESLEDGGNRWRALGCLIRTQPDAKRVCNVDARCSPRQAMRATRGGDDDDAEYRDGRPNRIGAGCSPHATAVATAAAHCVVGRRLARHE